MTAYRIARTALKALRRNLSDVHGNDPAAAQLRGHGLGVGRLHLSFDKLAPAPPALVAKTGHLPCSQSPRGRIVQAVTAAADDELTGSMSAETRRTSSMVVIPATA